MDATLLDPGATEAAIRPRRVRLCGFNLWAAAPEPAEAYLARLPTMDLAPLVSDSGDPGLMRKARLDCDWHGETIRCWWQAQSPEAEFLPAWAVGPAGVLELAVRPLASGEERWLICSGQQPQALGRLAGNIFALLRRSGVRILYYAFDEASRTMPCFGDIAPYLDVLIHDESPLDPAGAGRLGAACVTRHRSWVANFVPYAAPFNEEPERKILFLGSQLGLTDHRRRQIQFLQQRYKDRFVASHDHSIDVGSRLALNRFQVGFCPEGRKFTTPAMAQTHTDRPFWSGCLGMVPVSENSTTGNRLDDLAAAGLVIRYVHGDLESLAAACDQALELPAVERRRIYNHFNEHETIGAVIAAAIGDARGRSAT